MELWLTPLAPSEHQHGYAELFFHITHGAGMGWDGVVIVSMFPSLIHFSTTEILLGTLPTELNLNTSISPRLFWDTEHSMFPLCPLETARSLDDMDHSGSALREFTLAFLCACWP